MTEGSLPFKQNYSKQEFGQAGESMAERFLKHKGFHLVAKNYSTRWGEIDLVMHDGPILVFVEVRRRSNGKFGTPEESIHPKKIKHLVKAAVVYLMNTGSAHKMVRFDVVGITAQEIRHTQDAFSAGDAYYY
jgi:putative endonuclease